MPDRCAQSGWAVYEYGDDFYRFLGSFALRSAQRIIPKLNDVLAVRTVADFGCGQGGWLSVWRAAGASVVGIDGHYVYRQRLMIEPEEFHPADLAQPIDLGRQFDLVQSLEVAEHLPEAKAGQFIDTLTAHGACILFSAAVPGQGGENHVNEQPLGYWCALFGERGYAAVDYLRPLIADDPEIESWYRYNTLLYVAEEALAALPEAVRSCRVADRQELADYRPLPDRLRNALVRRLPTAAVDRLSRVRASLAARRAPATSDIG